MSHNFLYTTFIHLIKKYLSYHILSRHLKYVNDQIKKKTCLVIYILDVLNRKLTINATSPGQVAQLVRASHRNAKVAVRPPVTAHIRSNQ